MKRKAYLSAAIGLLAYFTSFGAIGGSIEIVETAKTKSYGLHSYSLAGRSFRVKVTNLADGTSVSNCYTFKEGGTWIDPAFVGPTPEEGLSPGTWIQHTGGFRNPLHRIRQDSIPGASRA